MEITLSKQPQPSPRQRRRWQPTLWQCLNGFVWLLMLSGTGLLLFNMAFYASFGLEHPFILEKSAVAGQLWLVCLVVHIPSSAICLLCGVFQLLPAAQKRLRKLHKLSGRFYVLTVLLVLVPTGMYLGLFAKGGLLGKSAFLFMGLFLLWSTWQGWLCAMRSNIPAHKRWMARSYALAAVAITFRFVHIAFFELGMPAETNYVSATWFSIVLNVGLAELMVSRAYWYDRFFKGVRNEDSINNV